MTSNPKPATLPAAENVKSWLWIAVWTIVGAVVGTVLAYILFGLVWTNWDAITGEVATPTRKRSGDPIDQWAKGMVAMMYAFPVILAGLGAGGIMGFRLGHRQHYRRTNRSGECQANGPPDDGDSSGAESTTCPARKACGNERGDTL